jgi:hypothetical protein
VDTSFIRQQRRRSQSPPCGDHLSSPTWGVPDPDSTAPPESAPLTHPHVWPARQGVPRPLLKLPPHPLGPSPKTLAAPSPCAPPPANPSTAAAFKSSHRRLFVIGEQSKSFAETCGSCRCCWFASPTPTASGRRRWRSAAATIRLLELRVIFFVGERALMP